MAMAGETTILPVMEKLRELVDLKEIIDPILGSRVKHSIDILTDLQISFEDPENNGLSLGFLQAVYRAEDTIDTFLEEINRQNLFIKAFPAGIHFRSVYIQTHFGNKIEKLVGYIKDAAQKMVADAASNRKASPDKKNGKLNLKEEVKELAELTINGSSKLFNISVVDVAGSAETTELWTIYDCDDIKDHFQCRAWVRIPAELEKTELLVDILKQVAGPDVEEKLPFVNSPQQELRSFLIQKRYLVVLIDVQMPDIWEILKFLFPNSSNGSRVILSFRETDAERHPDVKFFGGDLLLNPKEMQVSSPTREDIVRGEVTITTLVSDAEILEEETDIVGLKDQILDLARVTVNDGNEYFLISVVGVAGSGKTTLVKTIYNSSYTRRNFECRAWVNVYGSHDFDFRNVLSDILEHITQVKVEEELPLNELESKLTSILHEKRYLIVLDDVHLPGAWYDLKWIFSPKFSPNGSRVILITREAHVARSFSASIFLLEIRTLNRDESCQMFLKKVGRENTSPQLLEKIWKICGGLPLAISVLGGLLSTLPDSEWSEVIEKIMSGRKKKGRDQRAASSNEDQSIFLDDLASLDTSSIWGLGYKFLSPHLRVCLHYLCLFPKSYEIPVRRLHQLWLAERFVKPSEGKGMAPENRVEEDFDQLERRNMIEVVQRRSDARPKTCRVPSSLYDILSPNAKNMGYFHIHHNGRSDSKSNTEDFCVRRLAGHLDHHNNTPLDEDFEYLHSYISFDNRKGDKPADEVGHLLNKIMTKSGYGLLRVLDLEGVYKPVLPETIGKLRLLRYVGLRWTFLDSVPESVDDLPCLETLDVKHTNITTLPMSIWKAKTLVISI